MTNAPPPELGKLPGNKVRVGMLAQYMAKTSYCVKHPEWDDKKRFRAARQAVYYALYRSSSDVLRLGAVKPRNSEWMLDRGQAIEWLRGPVSPNLDYLLEHHQSA